MEKESQLIGTSCASPYIAATVGTIKSYNKELTNDQIYEILKYYSLDLGSTGRDDDYGHGMPCLKNYSECTCNCGNCDKIYCLACSCATCKYHEPQPKTLENIEIKPAPIKVPRIKPNINSKLGAIEIFILLI